MVATKVWQTLTRRARFEVALFLDCGDLSPPLIVAERLFSKLTTFKKAAPPRKQSGDKSPQSKWRNIKTRASG
jgi:hypothetical protein